MNSANSNAARLNAANGKSIWLTLSSLLKLKRRIKRGIPMSQSDLEERVSKLEQQMALLLNHTNGAKYRPGRDDWKKTLHMFDDDDPVMQEIIEETLKVREEDRRRTRP